MYVLYTYIYADVRASDWMKVPSIFFVSHEALRL